jgi:hypothetical protein
MNIDHDHVRGAAAVRGLLCPRCNVGHMRRVDLGERPIDATTREYLLNPWYLARRDQCLSYEPAIHVRINDLGGPDRAELDRLACKVLSPYSIQKAAPVFEHPGVAACVSNDDLRPVLRLLWMARGGYIGVDIASPIRGAAPWMS